MAADTTTSPGPDAKFLLAHPAHFIALGFGAGLAPKAPGTFGTLVAIPLYYLLPLPVAPPPLAFRAIPLLFVGVGGGEGTARALRAGGHPRREWAAVVAFLPLP